MFIQKRRIVAEETVDAPETGVTAPEADADVEVAPEATALLFETEDVAELLAEVTGEPVSVEAEDGDDTIKFTVGENEYTVEPDGDEEILEAVRKPLANKRKIAASAKPDAKSAARSATASGRVIARVASRK